MASLNRGILGIGVSLFCWVSNLANAQEDSDTAEFDPELLAELGVYAQMIQRHVENYWNHPPNIPENLKCVVLATQDSKGEVIEVRTVSCNGNEEVRRSVEIAVLNASPLPLPRKPELFSAQIQITFSPN